MKKIGIIILIVTSAILFVGCQKDGLILSGTSWKATIDDTWFALYFENSKSVIFTVGIGFESHSETCSYKVSENTITVKGGAWFDYRTLIFEKGEKYIYWDMGTLFSQDVIVKFIQQ